MSQNDPVACVCGRLLRDPASRARGLGPVCYRRLRGRTGPRRRAVPDSPPEIPGQLTIPIQPTLPAPHPTRNTT